MSTETIEALSDFKSVARPIEAQIDNRKTKYARLLVALANLRNDAALELPLSFIGGANFNSWLVNMKAQGKNKYKIRVGGQQKNGVIQIWANKI